VSVAIAVYPGTFDPVTNGHVDVIQRATTLFDEVIVAVAESAEKQPTFGIEDRLEMVRAACEGLTGVRVESYVGLTVDFARSRGAVAIIKGLRAVSDFETELQMALMNRGLSGGIETVFLPTSLEWLYLSSSRVKEIARMQGDVSGFVPEAVARRLGERF
jgi:pantetheine-phosphate adenylyltransferase